MDTCIDPIIRRGGHRTISHLFLLPFIPCCVTVEVKGKIVISNLISNPGLGYCLYNKSMLFSLKFLEEDRAHFQWFSIHAVSWV